MNESRLRILTIVHKEFREYRRNRSILSTALVMPAIFTILPIAQLLAIAHSAPLSALHSLAETADLMMLLVPLTLPSAIAAYAVIGERDQGTLEPLLTTPISSRELILGKALAAILPSTLIAYLIAIVFAVAVRIDGNGAIVSIVWEPTRILAQVVFVPLLATWSTWVAIAVSARSSDVRVAQQLSGLAGLPMVGLTSLFTFRVLTPNLQFAIVVAVLLFVIDRLAWRVVSAMFDRERLISRFG